MSSWNIIGWALIAIFLAWVLLNLLLTLAESGATLLMHLKTRNTRPAEGQIWRDKRGEDYYIGKCYAEHLVLHTRNPQYASSYISSASWSETYATWKLRVRNRRLRLAGHYKVK